MYFKMQIRKRDNRLVSFKPEKIKNAILKAFIAVDGQPSDYAIEKADNIADYIEGYCMDYDGVLSIEEIQDLVEHGLMSTKRKDVAKAYITYRQERTRAREANGTYVKNIKNKLNIKNNQRANANVDEESFGGRGG
jgi:ribonucleoside-triphosphate reductase